MTVIHTYLPMKMEQTVCSETSVYKIQTPGNYAEESIQPSKLFARWRVTILSSSVGKASLCPQETLFNFWVLLEYPRLFAGDNIVQELQSMQIGADFYTFNSLLS